MYTANSMNCLTEVLGMGLAGNGTIPAPYSRRIELAKEAGMQVMELVRRNIRPRDILTAEAFENALTADMALGCSTNSMLHLPAIANECGVPFDLDMANRVSERTPNLCHLAPAGPTYMEDLQEAGGVPAVLHTLAEGGLLHTDVMTCTGRTLGETSPMRACWTKRSSARCPTRTARPAASRCCAATWRRTAAWSSAARSRRRCSCTKARRACSTARRRPSR